MPGRSTLISRCAPWNKYVHATSSNVAPFAASHAAALGRIRASAASSTRKSCGRKISGGGFGFKPGTKMMRARVNSVRPVTADMALGIVVDSEENDSQGE